VGAPGFEVRRQDQASTTRDGRVRHSVTHVNALPRPMGCGAADVARGGDERPDVSNSAQTRVVTLGGPDDGRPPAPLAWWGWWFL